MPYQTDDFHVCLPNSAASNHSQRGMPIEFLLNHSVSRLNNLDRRFPNLPKIEFRQYP